MSDNMRSVQVKWVLLVDLKTETAVKGTENQYYILESATSMKEPTSMYYAVVRASASVSHPFPHR
jgi:hypothetical protein